jgi:hypothetical protein
MAETNLNYDGVIESLVSEVPALRDLYRDHVDFYEEVIPHLFFGVMTEFLVQCLREARSEEPAQAKRLACVEATLAFLERAITRPDPKVQELVYVSFIEELFGVEPEVLSQMTAMMGPALKKAYLEVVCPDEPSH